MANMFYSEAILSRRGPLARVWLAAHWERKLSKTQTLQTDISESVDAIMEQDVQVMAPRLSGQLLLGVVRIYTRKAKYLLDDCNEALLKIKMAFRPGIVDMTEDQLAVNRNAITLQPDGLDLDLMFPDLNLDLDFEPQTGGQHIARQADITLATADDLQGDLEDLGYDFGLGPGDGIGSQDFEFDLGLDFGDGQNKDNQAGDLDDSMSVEVARDAITLRDPRYSLDSAFLGNLDLDRDVDARSIHSRDPSEGPIAGGILDFDMDVGMDLDLGIDFGEHHLDNVPPFGKEKDSRASSPLTELPPTPPPPELALQAAIETAEEVTPKRIVKKPKDKKQIFDSVIELPKNSTFGSQGREDALGSQSQRDLSDILTKQYFLPASRTMMRLLEIRSDPVSYFMPTKTNPDGSVLFNAGPPGLAPQLSELFMRPITNLSLSSRRRGEDIQEERPKKKRRLDENINGDASDVEVARRAGSLARSIGIGSDIIPDTGAGVIDFGGAGMDDLIMDVEFPIDASADAVNMDLPSKIANETRHSTPAADFAEDAQTYTDANCPIAMFDTAPTQSQETGPAQEEGDDAGQEKSRGYSKNTTQALTILQKELNPTTEPEEGEKVLSFAQMSEKATRRAASSFFFELLVLSTRDCIKVSQSAAFENIEIRAKDKLWEHNIRSTRQASLAPSIASTFGL